MEKENEADILQELSKINDRLGHIEKSLDKILSNGGIGRTIGLALLSDTIAETIKRPLG